MPAISTVNGVNGAAGVAGVLSGKGRGTPAVTAIAYSLADMNSAQDSIATATGGNGGAGANAASPQSNAGSGGAGGGATAASTLVSSVFSADEAGAVATGGQGGDGGQNSFGVTGGNGGNGGGATATASATGTFSGNPYRSIYTYALAAAQGGVGGTAYGSGAIGGAGGEVFGTKAMVASSSIAYAGAKQEGGNGGAGVGGANGGAGAASELVNAVIILSCGAGQPSPSQLNQQAQGGAGGDSDTGHGGNGGLAISDLTADYTTNPAVAGDIEATVIGTGGRGGDGAVGGNGGNGGNGGPTWDAATITGASGVYLTTFATGGDAGANGQAGGDGQAKATAIGSNVDAIADASGGLGQTIAGTANATATGTGASGTAVVNTQTGLYPGNLVRLVYGHAIAQVDGTNTALSQAGIATTQPSNPGGAIAYIDALPVATYAARAEAGAPHTIAALGATPSIIAMGEIGGAHSTLGTDSQTSTATIGLTMDLLQLTSTPDLFLGFYNVTGSSSGITDINLSFEVDGQSFGNVLDYSSAAAAKAALNDIPMDVGSLGSGALAASSSLALQVTLSVTTDHAGSGFSTYLVLGHG